MKRFACMSAFFIMMSGCRTLTPPLEWPVFEQHAQRRVNTFSVIPSRRMVIVKSNAKLKNGGELFICAEASADVTDNLTSTLAASLAASKEAGANASLAVSKTLETAAQFLFKRTQGIQLYRDAMYHLCQAHMNGFITKKEYSERSNALLGTVIPLIQMELPFLQHTQPVNNPQSDTLNRPVGDAAAGKAPVSMPKAEEPKSPAKAKAPPV